MRENKIIILIIFLFIACSFWLDFSSSKILDLDRGKNWWTLSFSDPKNASLNFQVENHSANENFSYAIYQSGEKKLEKEIKIKNEATASIEIDSEINFLKTGKITIKVSQGKESREIYKNLKL